MQTATATGFQPLQSPALHQSGQTLAVSHPMQKQKILSLLFDSNQFLREIKTPTVSNISFEAAGIFFKARHMPTGNHSNLLIWGTLGYLPYSVSSPQKRQDLITILESTRRLPHIKFGVDPHMKIIVTGEYKITLPPTPDYLFVPLIRFLEESLPFVRLIGEHL